ncbi:hypothetical protein OIV83_004175 [Microbotryomycetes sp. JL201]|nr:hypothetical protein OIV83_004175 [Microbotryomycetes sp. JL201]
MKAGFKPPNRRQPLPGGRVLQTDDEGPRTLGRASMQASNRAPTSMGTGIQRQQVDKDPAHRGSGRFPNSTDLQGRQRSRSGGVGLPSFDTEKREQALDKARSLGLRRAKTRSPSPVSALSSASESENERTLPLGTRRQSTAGTGGAWSRKFSSSGEASTRKRSPAQSPVRERRQSIPASAAAHAGTQSSEVPQQAPPAREDNVGTSMFGAVWAKASQVLSAARGGGEVAPDKGSNSVDPPSLDKEEPQTTPTAESKTMQRPVSLPPSASDSAATLVAGSLLQKSNSEPRRPPIHSHTSILPAVPSGAVATKSILFHRPVPLHPRDIFETPKRKKPLAGGVSMQRERSPFDWLESCDASPLDAFLFHRMPGRAQTRRPKVNQRATMPANLPSFPSIPPVPQFALPAQGLPLVHPSPSADYQMRTPHSAQMPVSTIQVPAPVPFGWGLGAQSSTVPERFAPRAQSIMEAAPTLPPSSSTQPPPVAVVSAPRFPIAPTPPAPMPPASMPPAFMSVVDPSSPHAPSSFPAGMAPPAAPSMPLPPQMPQPLPPTLSPPPNDSPPCVSHQTAIHTVSSGPLAASPAPAVPISSRPSPSPASGVTAEPIEAVDGTDQQGATGIAVVLKQTPQMAAAGTDDLAGTAHDLAEAESRHADQAAEALLKGSDDGLVGSCTVADIGMERDAEAKAESWSKPPSPKLSLDWHLPELGLGVASPIMVESETLFKDLGLGAQESELFEQKEQGALPLPVLNPELALDDFDSDGESSDSPGKLAMDEAFAATTSFVTNFKQDQVPPVSDRNHDSRMRKWLSQQGVEPVIGVADLSGHVDLPKQASPPPSSRPRTAPPSSLGDEATLTPTLSGPMSISTRLAIVSRLDTMEEDDGAVSPTGAAIEESASSTVASLERKRTTSVAGPSLVFGGSVVAEKRPITPRKAQTQAVTDSSSTSFVPEKTVSSKPAAEASALPPKPNTALSQHVKYSSPLPSPSSPKLEIDAIFAGW